MAGIETGFSVFTQVFRDTGFNGAGAIILQATIIIASLLLVTRKVSDWKILAFPIIIGWSEVGMRSTWMLIMAIFSGIIFVISALSTDKSSQILGVGGELGRKIRGDTKETIERTRETGKRIKDWTRIATKEGRKQRKIEELTQELIERSTKKGMRQERARERIEDIMKKGRETIEKKDISFVGTYPRKRKKKNIKGDKVFIINKYTKQKTL